MAKERLRGLRITFSPLKLLPYLITNMSLCEGRLALCAAQYTFIIVAGIPSCKPYSLTALRFFADILVLKFYSEFVFIASHPFPCNSMSFASYPFPCNSMSSTINKPWEFDEIGLLVSFIQISVKIQTLCSVLNIYLNTNTPPVNRTRELRWTFGADNPW